MTDQLNTDEREILEKFGRDELKPASEADREMQVARRAARHTIARIRQATQGDGESGSER